MSKPFSLLPVGGFTFIELVTTISIASILLAVGIPSFQILSQSNRMTATVNEIISHLNLARIKAVLRGVDVIMCPSADGRECKNTMIWDQHIILFTDTNNSGQFEPGEELLKRLDVNSSSIRISTTIKRRKAAYDFRGFSMGNNVTFTFCDTKNKVAPKAVIVSNSGRSRLYDTKYDESPLVCN
jgi:type IV fimbrial biogenesis protein FimT